MSGLATRSASRPNPRLIAAFAVGAAGLAITGGGVYAALNATASNTTAQNATSGILSLEMTNEAGFTQAVSNLAPGDTVNRYVTLQQGADLAGQNLSLGVKAAPSTKLTNDDIKGLHVTVTRCVGGTWTTSGAGTCSGTTQELAPKTPLKTLLTSPATLIQGSIEAGSSFNLQVSLTLPDQDETTINGDVPANSIQGLSSALTWTFSETQRITTTTGS